MMPLRSLRTDASRSLKIEIDGRIVPIEIKRHASARRLTLRVSETRHAITVTLPMRCPVEEAHGFVERSRAWIGARLQRLSGPIPLADGMELPLRGEAHRIRFQAGRASIVRCEAVTRTIDVSGPTEHCPRRLKDWLVSEARKDLDRQVAWHAQNLGLRPRHIKVRDQSSRWGSCSSAGSLSFSWRLILAPPFVLDYVAAHEVCHLGEMNHGRRFWALVEKTDPDWQVARHWLKISGATLHRYAREAGETFVSGDEAD